MSTSRFEEIAAQPWSTLTQQERDTAYDNSAAVANSAALSAARNAASAGFRTAHPGKLDIAYGARERNRWDLFPADDPRAPCLVFIHGGYWQRNGREGFAVLAEGVRAHGWSVALPGYTLAPDTTLTDIVGEIRAALDWLATHGAAHGIAGKLIVSGWSAGGHLTAMALSHAAVSAGLAISGVYDLAPIRDTVLDKALHLTEGEIGSLSPLRLPVVQKPMLIAYGMEELPALIGSSLALFDLRADAHAPGSLLPVHGADHFTILDELRSPTGALTRAALSLA